LAFLLGGCPDREKVIVLWAAAEIKGTVAPCGCTTDPLGGIDKVAALVETEKRRHLLLAAGPLVAEEKTPEMEAKSALATRVLGRLGLVREGVREVGGIKVGIVRGIKERPAGVDVAIALLDMQRADARRAVREHPGFDLAIVGEHVDMGEPVPEKVGTTWLFTPADQLQKLMRIEIHFKGGKLAYAGGAGELEQLDGRIASLGKQLGEWKRAPDADRDFIAEREKELSALRAERLEKAKSGGVQAPPAGSWFSSALVPIRQKLPSDETVRAEMKQLDRTVGAENRKRDCAKGPPPLSEPHSVGIAKCGDAGCHPQAVAFWKKTVHAHAWQTLVDDGRQFHNECFGCHVTPGATLCKPEPLTDVQCEVCHGPASAHVAAGGVEEKSTLTRKPEPNFCADKCHTPQHSDTFQLEPYLRDILGEGHGAKRRAQLGEGTTGHELRQAALRKAGRAP
jgi:hypothetical protein